METKEYLMKRLGIEAPLRITTISEFEEPPLIRIRVEADPQALYPCPVCHTLSPCQALTEPYTWRHLDFWERATYLICRLPVVHCARHDPRVFRPLWGDPERPMTDALFRRYKTLSAVYGRKKAAAILFLQPRIITLLRESEAARIQDQEQGGPSTPPSGKKPDKATQLSLFGQPDTALLNQVSQAIRTLQPEKALHLLTTHGKSFPRSYDSAMKQKIARFLLQSLKDIPDRPEDAAAHLCRSWEDFENRARAEGFFDQALVEKIRFSLFEKAAAYLERTDNSAEPLLPGNIPKGFIYLQMEDPDRAIPALQDCIPTCRRQPFIYGCLGDAYWLRGDRKTARRCYLEATVADHRGLDWHHILDSELKELREELILHYRDQELGSAWLPVHARLQGIFERREVGINNGLRELVDDYLIRDKAFRKEPDRVAGAELFTVALTLSDNGPSLRFIKQVSVVSARQRMKDIAPDLFREYLEILRQEQKP